MKTKPALIALFFIASFMAGACDVWFSKTQGTSQLVITWLPTIILSALMFAWVYVDSVERQYSRSRLLSVGIVGLAIVFVPVYLYKSRPRDRKSVV